jgi:hypothetical protein
LVVTAGQIIWNLLLHYLAGIRHGAIFANTANQKIV